jgi:Txe/YoeB family toxin of Txe-Axe toxin-antitoxin module
MLNVKVYENELKRIKMEFEKENEINDQIEDNEEWEIADKKTFEKYNTIMNDIRETIFAINHATQPRNEWFVTFCKSLNQNQRLTDKQFEVFTKYAKCDQTCRYKTPVDTFRTIVNNKLYTVTNAKSGRKVDIEELYII